MVSHYNADDYSGLSSISLCSSNESAAQSSSIDAQKEDDLSLLSTGRGTNLRQTYDRVIADCWTYELLGVLVCIGALISIVAVLFAFDDKPTPRATAGFTLNTIVSLLSTLSRAAAVFVATSVIAQQKWLHFKRMSRPLIQAVYYDDATKGPLGSLYLLRTLRMSSVTALAAMATVLSLGFEASVQQSVSFPLQNRLDLSAPQALIPIVKNVNYTARRLSNESENIDLDSARHLYDLYTASDTVVNQALYGGSVKEMPSCSGAKCDWPLYESAAYCSLCQDAMHDVSIHPNNDTVLQAYYRNDYLNVFEIADLDLGMGRFGYFSKSWNTDYSISLGQGTPAKLSLTTTATVDTMSGLTENYLDYPVKIVWNLRNNSTPFIIPKIEALDNTYFLWSKDSINNVSGPIQAFGYVELSPSVDKSRLTATSAKRCIISLCAQQYSSKVENNTLSREITNMTWGSYGNGSNWTATLSGTQFHSADVLSDSSQFMNRHLSSLVGSIGSYEQELGIINANADTVQFLSDIEGNCAKIAQGMTNLIQQNGDAYVEGRVYVAVPCVEVRWIWLTFPVALVITVLTTLVTTIIQTKSQKLPLWRSSLFPLLYNFPARDDDVTLQSSASDISLPQVVLTSEHEEMAKKTHVRLRSTGGSWIFEKDSGK